MSYLQTIPEFHDPAPGVKLIGIADQRFKRASVQVLFELPLDSSRAARSLLLDVLEQGSAKFSDRTALARELQNLYGAACQVYSERVCEAHRVGLQLSCLGQQFLPDGENVLQPALELMSDVLFDPLRDNDGSLFNKGYFERERKNLLEMLAERKDNRSAFASERFVSLLCAGEDYGKLSWESSLAVAELTAAQLEAARLEIINTAQVTIVCSGAIDVKVVHQWAESLFDSDRQPLVLANISEQFPSELRHVNEHLEMEQAKFHLGLRINSPHSLEQREALNMACSILGGGTHGRLFRKIREEQSLAYGIYASLHGRKHILSVAAGIDASSADQVEAEVFKQIEMLAEQGPTAEEMDFARANRLNSLAALADSAGAMATFYHSDYLLDLNATPHSRASACQQLSAADVQHAANGWQADLVYLLSAE
ncbi:MAG: insulinase family protein [Planctomycetes bacterium]|nr:insulinase family protein [Planctomycetota bacterium]